MHGVCRGDAAPPFGCVLLASSLRACIGLTFVIYSGLHNEVHPKRTLFALHLTLLAASVALVTVTKCGALDLMTVTKRGALDLTTVTKCGAWDFGWKRWMHYTRQQARETR